METTKGNKIIAEFMGLLLSTDLEDAHINGHYYIGAEGDKNLHYHSSWDWLMPVVEHIESLGFASVIEKVAWKTSVIHRVWFTSLEGKQQEVGAARDEEKIAAVWLAVVAFIQWYNDQKK